MQALDNWSVIQQGAMAGYVCKAARVGTVVLGRGRAKLNMFKSPKVASARGSEVRTSPRGETCVLLRSHVVLGVIYPHLNTTHSPCQPFIFIMPIPPDLESSPHRGGDRGGEHRIASEEGATARQLRDSQLRGR